MFNLNRRQFLLRSTLAIAATVTYEQVQAQKPTSPGALPQGLPRRKVLIVGAGIAGLVAAYELTAVGQIYFAGEHTSKTRGLLQRALESGLNAAKEIHFAPRGVAEF